MKSKTNFLCICTIQLCLAATQNIMAQQTLAQPADHRSLQIENGQPVTGYTYKVFQAPDKMFGYDIFQNGKGVFHQPAAMVPPNDIAITKQPVQRNLRTANDQHSPVGGFSKREFAENAARLSIEKIKKRLAPSLTTDELKQLIANPISTPAIKR